MDSVMSINDLTYSIFNNLNVTIKKNTITAISGANNCGKTTLIRILEKYIIIKKSIKLNNKYIEEYTTEEYNSRVQTVIPSIITFYEKTLIDELKYQCNNEEKINEVLKIFKFTRQSKKNIDNLNQKEKFLSQIIIGIINSNQIVAIDNIDYYFETNELRELYNCFYKCIKKYDLTFLITCLKLDSTLFLDELYIINNGKEKLHGNPLEVLKKDNIINKIGLEIPFMVDLSVKLIDYDLINDIELDKEKLIEALWN